MNTITLNGTASSTITGLLVQELPPISKPPMRVMIEEIDGRDGDLITDLGYQAYDKEASIGLHGSFDVDKVIEFFNSEGKVVFSNEPTKFYYYKIINQMDLERLVRFRTGTVTFHVQPFKYSTTETAVTKTSSPASVTNNGNYFSKPILTITGSGTVNLSLNGTQIFVIDMSGNIGNITIDTEKMEAYKGNDLMNRRVTGDYNKFSLNKGSNSITWTGSVSKIVIENYSRWV